MKVNVDTRLSVLGTTYNPIDIFSEPYEETNIKIIVYLYHITNNTPNEEPYTVYIQRFSNETDYWAINVRKGTHTISAYLLDNIDKKYAGALCVKTAELEEEVERLIVEFLRYSDLSKWMETEYPGLLDNL